MAGGSSQMDEGSVRIGRARRNKPKAMSTVMQRWQTQHERDIYQLLQFPEKSGHLIESGEALNKLLDVVGAAAFQNSQTRKVSPDHALPLYQATEYTQVDESLVGEIRTIFRAQNSSGSRRLWKVSA